MARILIVENEPVSAELMTLICRGAKHAVTVASNGIEALLVLDALPFDLIVTELSLPKMDGITLTGMIRASGAAHAAIPIVAMTGLTDLHGLQTLRDVGIDQFLPKPCHGPELLRLINGLLARNPEKIAFMRDSEGEHSAEPRSNSRSG